MADVRTTRRRVPRATVLLAGAGALLVSGYLASIYVREELAIAALRSPDLERRVAAAETLGELGTVRAIPALLDCERPEEESEDVSRVMFTREPAYAFQALDRILRSAAVPMLLRVAREEKTANRIWAIEALGRVDTQDDEVFRVLEGALEDQKEVVARAAAASLPRFGRQAVPCLLRYWTRSHRWIASDGGVDDLLLELGPLGWTAVESLLPLIGDRAIRGVHLILDLDYLDGGVGGQIALHLQQQLAGMLPESKEALAVALYELTIRVPDGSRAFELAPVFEALLDDDNPDLRESAIAGLRWCTGKVSEKMLRVAVELARDGGTRHEGAAGIECGFWAFRQLAPTRTEELRPLLKPLERDPQRYELLLHRLAESPEHSPAALALLEERGVSAESVAMPELASPDDTSLERLLEEIRGNKSGWHELAVRWLRTHKPTAQDLPLLERSLTDRDTAVQAIAAHLIGNAGQPGHVSATALEAVARGSCLTVRVHAALALCRLGSAPRDLEPVFREALKMEPLKELGVEGLIRLRADGEVELRSMLFEEPDYEITNYALATLDRMGADAAAAVPLLREIVRDGGGNAPFAVRVLGSIGRTADAAVPELTEFARWARPGEREEGIAALVSVAPSPATAAQLAQFLLDPVDGVRAAAARGLLELAPHAAGTIPFLMICLRRSHRALEASVILSRIGPPAIPQLLEALDDADADLRVWAAWTLGGMGAAAAGAVEALERRLQDPDELARAAAGHALGLIGTPAERSIPALERLTSDTSTLVRRQSATALRRLLDPQAWRPTSRDLPLRRPETLLCNGTVGGVEEGRFHAAVCERHRTP